MNSRLARRYGYIRRELEGRRYHWLVTGAAGFIGSNLVEALLALDQRVTGLDNFATGYRHNLEQVRAATGEAQWAGFRFIEGDIRSLEDCRAACEGVEIVLHQAALGSVARSIEDPIATNATNVGGFVNMLASARDAGVRRFVYAASSSTYGDHPGLPKVEQLIGRPLSPYAVTKYVNELYADVFHRCYGIDTVGLRYFNVFGQRQDPDGAYAAVIPQWLAAMIGRREVVINGDGETSRDFCYIDNVVQANLLAATVHSPDALNQVYNIALGERTTLLELYELMRELLARRMPHAATHSPRFGPFRAGDVRHSQADISKAQALLGYAPTYHLRDGLHEALDWYVRHL
ncbi:SDR family oxidoreductase [Pseudoduganella sp. GCM10020061]|uniref:SDR family oxidoreductase n=1 Tax=Pseudoduganella sp. GCM10020061 TaxID=3317345 RepID=UPI00362712A5